MCIRDSLYSYQKRIQCDSCFGWVHHGNRLKCSGLTDIEFQQHVDDIYKPFECDHWVSERISKSNNSVFQFLPFPLECEDNIFGKPTETKCKPDISSMTTSELNKFVKQCRNIENQFDPVVNDEEEDEFFNSSIDSNPTNPLVLVWHMLILRHWMHTSMICGQFLADLSFLSICFAAD